MMPNSRAADGCRRFMVQCDRALIPVAWYAEPWERRLAINQRGVATGVNLVVQPLSEALGLPVTPEALDLVHIAAYAYIVDQLISRGDDADVFADDWRRTLALCVPVNLPELWSSPQVLQALTATLAFATGDDWRFAFTRWDEPLPVGLGLDPRAVYGEIDAVHLFSGGTDSLCAAVEALAAGRRPLLVSHEPEGRVEHQQKLLATELRRHYPHATVPQVGVKIHKSTARESDTSQRTRGFLYASLGVAIAHALGLARVVLADNGVVSLNLPLNDQLVGALASRSTHPQFLDLFNRLAEAALTNPPRLENPLRFRTRAETLSILKRTPTVHLLDLTRSCASGARLPSEAPQCGVCSQCVDRRFAVLAEALEDADPVRGYTKDVLLDDLDVNLDAEPYRDERTMPLSYARFARTYKDHDAEALLDAFPQLGDTFLPNDPNPEATTRKLCAMIQRQCRSVWAVAEQQMEAARAGRTRKPPTATSLLGLLLHEQGAPLIAPNPLAPNLTDEEEERAQQLGFKARQRIVLTGELAGRSGNIVLIGKESTTVPDQPFLLLLRLVVASQQSANGYVSRGSMTRGTGLVAEGIYPAEEMDQVTSALRLRLRGYFAGLAGPDIVEVARGRVRLSVPPRLVTANRARLLEHPNQDITRWATRLRASSEDQAPA